MDQVELILRIKDKVNGDDRVFAIDIPESLQEHLELRRKQTGKIMFIYDAVEGRIQLEVGVKK